MTVENLSDKAIAVYYEPRLTQPASPPAKLTFDEPLLPHSLVTITNVVGDASSPIWYEVSIQTTTGSIKGYVPIGDLKVGHTADLFDRIKAAFSLGLKTGIVASRNAGQETKD